MATSILKVDAIQHTAQSTPNIMLDASGSVTFANSFIANSYSIVSASANANISIGSTDNTNWILENDLNAGNLVVTRRTAGVGKEALRITANGAVSFANNVLITGNTVFNSTVSGAGLNNYLASPPAIGTSSANTARFTSVSANNITANTISATSIIVAGDVSWTQSTDSYTRSSGSATTQIITDVHINMRRCTLLDNGTVNYYLDSANSALKADGTAADLTGADGMVMVEIPAYYVKFTPRATRSWAVSLLPAPGFVLHPAFMRDGTFTPYRYYGAYDACVWTTGTTYQSGLNYDDNVGAGQNWNTGTAKLASVSGIYPATGISRAETRTMAANRGTRWRQLDFYLLNAVQILYLVEYGSFNSQSKIGLGNVQVTNAYNIASSGNQTDSPHSIAGKSNSIGNATGALASTTRDTAWMSYRGIENWYGNCWNWVDGFNINSNQGYVSNVMANFADDTATNYSILGSAMPNSEGYPTNLQQLPFGFLPSSIGGSSSTYLTDYYYQNPGWRVAGVGGYANSGAAAGAFFWSLSNASSSVLRYLGARLVF
nr:MAG: hypothetical protein [Caudoviricetes sp.]